MIQSLNKVGDVKATRLGLASLLGGLLLGGVVYADVTFSDSTMSDANWTGFEALQTGSGSFTASQANFNVDDYRRIDHIGYTGQYTVGHAGNSSYTTRPRRGPLRPSITIGT